MQQYELLKKEMIQGWHTWNNRSVLSHVLMPFGFAVTLGIKEYRDGQHLTEALIGRQGAEDEVIHPGLHAYDDSYTSLNLKWRDMELEVASAVTEGDLVLMVKPIRMQRKPATLVIESAMLWNRPGLLSRGENRLTAQLDDRTVTVFATGCATEDLLLNIKTPCLTMELSGPVFLSAGRQRTPEEIMTILEENKARLESRCLAYGPHSETYKALQSCMAWDTIYEPKKHRVVTPVSRIWNNNFGGYVLFCWDTYFGALMASLDNKALAYSNAIEITREKTENGFVPNFAAGTGVKSRDRSQPPVGSLVISQLYRKYGEKWLLEEVFDDLLGWNQWFFDNRRLPGGALTWGSNPYESFADNRWESDGVNDRFGASLESGLDNSPMYDGIPFDTETHLLRLADVGLTGLYALDCRCLSRIAAELGKAEEAEQLSRRAAQTEDALETLWDNSFGMYLNLRTDTGAFEKRLSPTHFYALFSGKVSGEHLSRMIAEHFMNPEEFFGEWILPSIARNDPAYPDQDYWRGRIWAPMNFLVYLALCCHSHPEAQKARSILAEKSEALLLKEWLEHGHVHENYCGDTGEGCNVPNSDRFYHWGALLGLIALMEAGFVPVPEA